MPRATLPPRYACRLIVIAAVDILFCFPPSSLRCRRRRRCLAMLFDFFATADAMMRHVARDGVDTPLMIFSPLTYWSMR